MTGFSLTTQRKNITLSTKGCWNSFLAGGENVPELCAGLVPLSQRGLIMIDEIRTNMALCPTCNRSESRLMLRFD